MNNKTDTKPVVSDETVSDHTQARIREAFFAGWAGGKSAYWVYKGQADRAFEKFLNESTVGSREPT